MALLGLKTIVSRELYIPESFANPRSFWRKNFLKKDCETVIQAPPIGKIHPFTKMAVTFEPVMGFWCPSGFRKVLVTMT